MTSVPPVRAALACLLAAAAVRCSPGVNGRLPDAGRGADGPGASPGGALDAGASVSPNAAGVLGAAVPAEGAAIAVDADALVDQLGNPPQFPIVLRLRRLPIERYEDMPGA